MCDIWWQSSQRTVLGGQSAPMDKAAQAAAGNALATLLANEEDVERLGEVGDLVVDCTSAEELLRRGRGLLNGGG